MDRADELRAYAKLISTPTLPANILLNLAQHQYRVNAEELSAFITGYHPVAGEVEVPEEVRDELLDAKRVQLKTLADAVDLARSLLP